MEPPDCQHDITLQPGQVMYLESSHRNHTHNGEGECSVRITNSDTTKHLAYTFEIGEHAILESHSVSEGNAWGWSHTQCLRGMHGDGVTLSV